MHVLLDKFDKSLDFRRFDVFLQQLPVVVKEGRDGVLGKDVVSDLLLHESKVLGNVFLKYEDWNLIKTQQNEPIIQAFLVHFAEIHRF